MGSLVHLKVHQGAFILSFPIVSCETLNFFVESKRKSNKYTLLRAATIRQVMPWHAKIWLAFRQYDSLFKYKIGSKVCTERI